MEKASEVLLAARALIEQPERWWNGVTTFEHSKTHCVVTALCEAAPMMASSRYRAADLFAAANALPMSPGWHDCSSARAAEFNDSHTHAEVLAAFNNAIGLALEAEGPQPELMPAHLDEVECATKNETGHVALA